MRLLIILFSVIGLLFTWILGFGLMNYSVGDHIKWSNHLPVFLAVIGSFLFAVILGNKLREVLRISQ